ncbi:MAG: hypothetical protein JO345_06110 [Streptosporangiaceae bacterium]|nr:hypothetical protein [Streptosporangiaceae bacterium]
MPARPNQPGRRLSLAERLPQGRQFPAHAGELTAQLGIGALRELDGVVRRLGPGACLRPPVFAQLVAYVGETLKAGLGGDWQTRPAADGTGWEPWLVDASGREHAPAGIVFKELTQWGPEASLSGVVRGDLIRYGGPASLPPA